MMKLNRKVEYALIALCYMQDKRPGELTSVKEIASLHGCSFNLTSRVLQKLAAAGILQSVQGAQGGYLIVKDLADVSFLQLNSLLTEPAGLTRCIQGKGAACEIQETCNIISPIKRLNEKLQEFYKSLSVSALLNGPSRFVGAKEVELMKLVSE